MKIAFTAQVNFNKYSLDSQWGTNIRKIPAMTEEQVDITNKTRKMPENYYVMTKETNRYYKNGHLKGSSGGYLRTYENVPVITVIKGEKNYYYKDYPSYYNTLPEGFEIENTITGTYLKRSDVKSALYNQFKIPLYLSAGAVLGFIFSKLLKRK